MHGKNLLILVALGIAAASCAGSRPSTEGIPPANLRPKEPSRGDRRVVCAQFGKGKLASTGEHSPTIIMVNEGHSLRATPAGRVALAGGDPGQPYAVVSETIMDNLLQTLEALGMSTHSRPFAPGDERWLGQHGNPAVKGAVLVEDNGVQRIVVGHSPASDPALLAPYKCFVDAKSAIFGFLSGARTEVPAATHVLQ